MVTTLMIFHAVISVLLIILVLLQFGKGAEAGLMGGGASDQVFTTGQQGNIFSKATIVISIIFMVNCIVLAKIQSSSSQKSILDSEAPVARPLNFDETEGKAQSENTPSTPDMVEKNKTEAETKN